MNTDLSAYLPSRQTLLAVGMSLVIAGIFLQGFATSNRRARELSRQHDLHHRNAGTAEPTGRFNQPPGWLERNIARLANLTLVAGLVLIVAAFFRN